MANYAYWAEALTGGANGALDAIDGSDLVDKDMAIVAASASSTSYIYWLDEDNAGAESSPTIIAPDNNGGDKRWVLIGQIFPNTGLKILDTNSSHTLNIVPGSDLTADRILTLTTGDAARTITLSGNPTLADWFDQNVKTTGTPQFARVGFGAAADANAIIYAVNAADANLGLFERSGQTADNMYSALRILATKTTDMGDGFGSAVTFNIRDNADIINRIGVIAFRRSGADNTSTLVLRPYNDGNAVDGITCDNLGNATILLTLTLPNTGLHLLDTNASHDLIIAPGSDLSADRTLTITTGDADRTLTIGGDYKVPVAQTVTISSGVATVTGPGLITLCAESGTTDQLDKIEGLAKGDEVALIADTGDTITVARDTYIKSPIAFTLTGTKTMKYINIGSDIIWELSRSANAA